MVGAEAQADYERTLRLPTSAKWPATKATWVMGGFKLAKSIEPVSVATEARLILSLIDELRKGLALELDVDPTFDRLVPATMASDKTGVDYLVIGRSGPVAMMAEALIRNGHTVNRADSADWRINKSFVGHLADLTTAAIKEARPRAVVVIGIEESFFMAQFEVGYTLPATKDAAGHHHINGELVVANAETQLRLLKAMDPIWVATRGLATVVVSPMARYLTKGCCEDPGHITNKDDANYASKMKSDLLAVKYRMKTFFNDNGHTHCIVMYPAKDLENGDLSQVWGNDDPTLPLPAVFNKMAAAVRAVESKADTAGKKRTGSSHDGPPPKRAKKAGGNDGPAATGGRGGQTGKKSGGESGGGAGPARGQMHAGTGRGRGGQRGLGSHDAPAHWRGHGGNAWRGGGGGSSGGGGSNWSSDYDGWRGGGRGGIGGGGYGGRGSGEGGGSWRGGGAGWRKSGGGYRGRGWRY
jgi:hypothetical protein